MIASKETARELLGLDKVNLVDYVAIQVASPENIRSWSKGEVKNPETINYPHSNRKRAVCFVSVFSGPSKTGNVPVESTSALSTVGSFVTAAVSK